MFYGRNANTGMFSHISLTRELYGNVYTFVDAPAVYQNAPSFAYFIGDYTVSKTGTVSGPANEALMAALNAKGFIAE